MPAIIIHFLGCEHCPLARDSEPIRLLEISTSLNYMLIRVVRLYITSSPGPSGYFSKWRVIRHFEKYPKGPGDEIGFYIGFKTT